jgi:hypothetical protein
LGKQGPNGGEEFIVEMEIMADAMTEKMPERLFNLQVFLPALVAKMALQFGAAIEAIFIVAVMFLHR